MSETWTQRIIRENQTQPGEGSAKEKEADTAVKAQAAYSQEVSLRSDTKYDEIRETVKRNIIDECSRLFKDDHKASNEEIMNLIHLSLSRQEQHLTRLEESRLSQEILDDCVGLGPLEPLLRDATISEIMVNGPSQIYVERSGKLMLTNAEFRSEKDLLQVINRIVSAIGRRCDESNPMVDARLADGSRVNAVIPPIALKGPSVTIRKFSKRPLQISDLIGFGSLNTQMAGFLEAAVKGRCNIIVSGGTGSGKTTLLNVLSAYIPQRERIVTVEDAAELQLIQDHVVSLESRPANIEGKGAVTIRDLVRNALRMRPDRIIVGEVRSGEALDMLQAMNTGHDGSLTTVHANSARDVISRLETMVMMSGMELPERAIREQIVSAIDLVVQQSRLRDGSRKIVGISEIIGMEGDTVVMQDIFTFNPESFDAKGRISGSFIATGVHPRAAEKIKDNGIVCRDEWFIQKRGVRA